MKSKTCVITARGKRVCGKPVSRASGAGPRSKDAKLEALAKHVLGFSLTVPSHGDRIRNTAVWAVRDALDSAYRLGVMSVQGHASPETRMPEADAADLARRELRFPTLERRYNDSLDFRNVSLDGVKNALGAAYDQGKRAGKR